jgi:ABC-2 type transport system ATP-binding protein
MACIEAQGLRKVYGTTVAVDGINLRVEEGRILGLIGPNGAGKTTALDAILGLTSYEGQLTVLGRDPWAARDELMRDVSFIADVAVLPRWMKVSQALDYVAGVHPRFDRAKAEGFLAKTTIKRTSKVRELSKGMVAQLHLALVMAIDAKLLVLDEPTLGLDILYRKQFYDSLLNDYFDKTRTIVVTTHQVEEIQDVLTDLMFIDRGRIVLECSMEEFDARYLEVMVHPEHLAEARALKPMHERPVFGRNVLLFDGADRAQLAALGEVRRPSIADLFVATMGKNQRSDVGSQTSESRIQNRESRIENQGRRDQMTAQTNPPPLFSGNAKANGLGYYGAPTRPLYWSVWRELWENRSIYIAPLIVAAVQVFGFAISAIGLAERRHAALVLGDPVKLRAGMEQPYDIAAMMMIFTVFIVGVFYCLDALHGERRDRSILFWKSLPVSDLTTVLSKVAIPLVILPLISFALVVCVQLIMVMETSVVLIIHGMSPATTWTVIPFFQDWLVMLYGLVTITLWHAPIYGWLLLVSGWARRATFLWAVLPLIAIQIFEKITFDTSYCRDLLRHRLMGFAPHAFGFHGDGHPTIDSLAQLTPGRYLISPGLWLGLLVAAVFLAAAVWQRRYRGPI